MHDELASVCPNGVDDPDPAEQHANLLRSIAVADSVDDSTVEANYYYGLGSMMRPFTKALATPTIRSRVVDAVSQDIARLHVGFEEPLGLEDFSAELLRPPFVALAKRASANLPSVERSLTNALGAVVWERRYHGENLQTLAMLARSEIAAQDIGAAAFAGLLMVLKTGWHRMYSPETEPPVDEALGPGRLRSYLTPHEAAIFARYRVDELLDNETRQGIVHVDEGRISCNADLLKQHPGTIHQNSLIMPKHTVRLQCPAIKVAGLIPLMMNVLSEIIAETAEYTRHPERILPPSARF